MVGHVFRVALTFPYTPRHPCSSVPRVASLRFFEGMDRGILPEDDCDTVGRNNHELDSFQLQSKVSFPRPTVLTYATIRKIIHTTKSWY